MFFFSFLDKFFLIYIFLLIGLCLVMYYIFGSTRFYIFYFSFVKHFNKISSRSIKIVIKFFQVQKFIGNTGQYILVLQYMYLIRYILLKLRFIKVFFTGRILFLTLIIFVQSGLFFSLLLLLCNGSFYFLHFFNQSVIQEFVWNIYILLYFFEVPFNWLDCHMSLFLFYSHFFLFVSGFLFNLGLYFFFHLRHNQTNLYKNIFDQYIFEIPILFFMIIYFCRLVLLTNDLLLLIILFEIISFIVITLLVLKLYSLSKIELIILFEVGIKYFFISGFSTLFMLLGLFLIFFISGTNNFSFFLNYLDFFPAFKIFYLELIYIAFFFFFLLGFF